MGKLLLSCVVALASPLFAQADRAELVLQIQASDALAQHYEAPPTTRPTRPMSYDLVLRSAIDALPQDESEPPDIASLSEPQLRALLSLLHHNNMEQHVRAAGPDLSTPAKVKSVVSRAATQPSRSQVFIRYVEPPMVIVHQSPLQSSAFAPESETETGNHRADPERSSIAVLSGAAAQRAFGIPSGIAPLDARRPGSQQLAQRAKGTLPLPAYADRTYALRAPPPGTPEPLLQSPEETHRIAGALGVPENTAEEIAAGRMTVADALTAGADDSGPVTRELLGGLVANDPRWQPLYFSPQLPSWHALDEQPFTFTRGGGQYVRSDQRVNQDFDLRTNGDLDRRVNVQNDRRTTIRLDPRQNH